jgi:hypothetical protein
MKASNWIKVLAAIFALAFLAMLTAAPIGQAQAAEPPQGSPADACQSCHQAVYIPWLESRHGTEATNCFACHKLGAGEGAHPQRPYLNLSEEETCDVCHADILVEWQASRHGDFGMGCITCHEPHSQQQKLIGDNHSTCENCHRAQLELTHGSTHGAVGLNCYDCHMGPDLGHTFVSEISTCQACHSNIHEADSLIRGVSITPVVSDIRPRIVEPTDTRDRGGINLPTWVFFVIGVAIGGGGVWVLIERELDVDGSNGKPKDEDDEDDEDAASKEKEE